MNCSVGNNSDMDAKELIVSKVEERKTITDYHLTTKKAQATVLRSNPTLTITVLSDQVHWCLK